MMATRQATAVGTPNYQIDRHQVIHSGRLCEKTVGAITHVGGTLRLQEFCRRMGISHFVSAAARRPPPDTRDPGAWWEMSVHRLP